MCSTCFALKKVLIVKAPYINNVPGSKENSRLLERELKCDTLHGVFSRDSRPACKHVLSRLKDNHLKDDSSQYEIDTTIR